MAVARINLQGFSTSTCEASPLSTDFGSALTTFVENEICKVQSSGQGILEIFGYEDTNVEQSLQILIGMWVAYLLLAILFLELDAHKPWRQFSFARPTTRAQSMLLRSSPTAEVT